MGVYNERIERVTRSKNDARIFYSRISRFYAFLEGNFERKYLQICAEKLYVKKGEVVLDIGFGTGESIIDFAQIVGDSGKVYGVDIAEGMQYITRMKLEKKDLLDHVELICKDAVNLSFKDDFFDKVFMSFTLELFDTPEIAKVLSECFRILKKGGLIGVVSLSKKKINVMVNMYEWFHRLLPKIFDCRPIFVEDILNENGFKTVYSSVISMFGLPVEIVIGEVKKQ